MTQIISGPGVGLQLPAYLYPTELYNAPYDFSNNYMTLAPGDAIPVPAGRYWIELGAVAVLQYPDPVTGIWRGFESGRAGGQSVDSNGFNLRVANLTGCPVAAVVQAGGTGYSQATATVTPSAM